jgi:hypothetical protein
MSVLRRATDQQQSEWTPIPEGLWRFCLGQPELKQSEKYGGWQVRFPLVLVDTEQERLEAEYGTPDDGSQQSWRTSYYTPLKLGWLDKTGQYQSTKLIDFLAASLGHSNSRKFYDWIANGGGPPQPADKDDDKAEMALIAEWLKWWEDLEVYGTINHKPGSTGTVWANFAQPIAVGSLPGQKDDEYQTHGRGKLRSIIAESHPELSEHPAQPARQQQRVAVVDRPAERYTRAGKKVEDDPDDLPF